MSVTITQIAQMSGVTDGTVSRVLSGTYQATRRDAVKRADRIRRVALELGYRRNAAARAISTGRHGCVGMVLATVGGNSVLSTRLYNGILDALHDYDMYLAVARVPDEWLSDESQVPHLLREMACDGLVINYAEHAPSPLPELIERYKIPAIWINAKAEHDCVYPDDVAGGELATHRLIEAGHRRILYLDPTHSEDQLAQAHFSVRDRLEGYRSAMLQAGLSPQHLICKPGAGDHAYAIPGLAALLQSPQRPTAILTYGHWERVMLIALNCGLRVPKDLSVVMFSEGGPRSLTPVSHAEIPFREMGIEAVKSLLRKIEFPSRPVPAVRLPFRFEPGATFAPPPVS